MLIYEKDDPMRWFVTYAIEDVLSESTMLQERTKERLENGFGCNISECFFYPHYLKEVLHDIYGSASTTIIQKIASKLEDHDQDKAVFRFIRNLNY